MDDSIKKLEARIVELEQRLAQTPRRPEPTNVSAEEMQAYHKIRDLVAADWGDPCGINECFRCVCVRCHACHASHASNACLCVKPCINECVCGPCNICSTGGGGFGGAGGFGGFGG